MSKATWHSVFSFMGLLIRCNRHIIAGALLLASLPAPNHLLAADAGVRLVSSDRSGVVVELTPVYAAPRQTPAAGNTFVRIEFEGEQPQAGARPGMPDLGERRILLALPGRSGRATVVSADYEDVNGIVPAPVPDYMDYGSGPNARYAADAALYSRPDFQPAPIAALDAIGPSRGFMYGELRISPLQYNGASRVLRRYTRIVVRVDFDDEGLPLAPSGALEPLDIARALPVQRRASGMRRNSVLASGPWHRMAVSEDGMYRITGQALLDAGVPAPTDPATLKIYSNGGTELPMDVTAPDADDLRENAVMTFDGGIPGQLDAADYIVFYGRGTRGWNYNPGTRTFAHYINHTSETNVSCRTYGGGRR